MPRVVLAIAVLLILAMGSVAAFDSALKEGGERTSIENESFSPTAGSVTSLDDSSVANARYDTNVTVRDSNHVEVDPGTDYEWFESNGTIKTVTGGALDGESTAYIDYGYDVPTAEQREMATLLAHMPRLIGIAIPAVAAIILLGVFLK